MDNGVHRNRDQAKAISHSENTSTEKNETKMTKRTPSELQTLQLLRQWVEKSNEDAEENGVEQMSTNMDDIQKLHEQLLAIEAALPHQTPDGFASEPEVISGVYSAEGLRDNPRRELRLQPPANSLPVRSD